LEYGAHYNFFKELQKQGKSTPLDIKIERDLVTDWFISSFLILSNARSSNGYGPNPLTIADIVSYFSIKEPIFEVNLTLRVIQHLDTEYLDFLFKKEKAKNSNA